MEIALIAATPADTPVVERLLQMYEHDFSEYGGIDVEASGIFPTGVLRIAPVPPPRRRRTRCAHNLQ
jgi:hypothetical protein